MTPAIRHSFCTLALVMFVLTGSPQGASAQDSGATPVLADKSPVAELAFWNTIKESQNAFDYKTYLENFPDGMFYDQALERFENAGGKKSQLSVLPADQTSPGAATSSGTPTPPPAAVVKTAPAKTKKSTLKARKSKKSKKQAAKHKKKKRSTNSTRKTKKSTSNSNVNCPNGRASDGTCLPEKTVTKHRRFHLLGGDSGRGDSGGSHSRGGGWGG